MVSSESYIQLNHHGVTSKKKSTEKSMQISRSNFGTKAAAKEFQNQANKTSLMYFEMQWQNILKALFSKSASKILRLKHGAREHNFHS